MNKSVGNEFTFLIAGWSYIFIDKQVPPREQMVKHSVSFPSSHTHFCLIQIFVAADVLRESDLLQDSEWGEEKSDEKC